MRQKIIKQEQGRSMVEMLGTLAIIGVLSVGGIAGYTYGMNRYYTNEILAGASARAVIVASQIASGQEISLSEFDKMKDTAGGSFDGTVKKFDDGLGIKVSGVKKSVCENLIKDIEETDIGIETEAGGEVTCGDENSFYITFASMGVGGDESAGQTCELTAEDCLSGELVAGECACAPAEGATCTSYTTNECGSGMYCQFRPSSCSASGNGVCTKITGGTETASGYLVSNSYIMDWWSANSWCIGKGRSGLITYSTLQSAYGCDKSTYSCNWSAVEADSSSRDCWCAEDFGSSCFAWVLLVTDDEFTSTARSSGAYAALCE